VARDPLIALVERPVEFLVVATMNVELVAPDRMIWSGEAEMVIARTTEGDIGILPNHEPVLGVLVESPVRIKRGEESELVAAVHGGFLSVSRNGVSILAEVVELAEEIDASRARQALERTSGEDDDESKAAARRAAARLRTVGETV
jgi:F-type H+-transporting ATPase subunit epsilon